MLPGATIFRRTALLLLAALAAGMLEAAVIVGDGLRDRRGHADVALVLGNEVGPDGTPSARLRARLDRTAEGYRHDDFSWVIASGGAEPNGQDEAAVMRAYLVAHGVPAARVIADHEGINTYASARFTARTVRERGWQSVCVVTQYYHVPRARLALTRFGVGRVYSEHARFFEWRDAFAILREMAGNVTYRLRSYDRGAPGFYSTNNFPPRRRACRPPGRFTFAGPSATSSNERTNSTSR